MNNGRLITVSFRLPYRFVVSQSRLSISPSVGGLATTLRSYFEGVSTDYSELHWIGMSDISRKTFDRVTAEIPIKEGNILMHPFFLPEQRTKERFYDGFCNSVIWPLFLYFPSFVVYKQDFFDAYVRVNELMCEEIRRIYQPGDTIWIHDYHWMLLPALLRRELPDARIGFFLHIPFPSFELYRMLPKSWGTELILGMMGADVIGFQTDNFGHHFVESMNQLMPKHVEGFLGIGDRQTLIKCSPISIDYKKFSEASRKSETRKNIKKIRDRLKTNKLILSIDRLDYTKAVLNRLESYELFLEQNPDFREKVAYLLIMVPSRESILKYKENKITVEAIISRINGKFGTIGWAPVVYHYQTVDFNKLVALYGAADVALVVSSRDGMNLVAKEFVTCKTNTEGVLILSETAGAADELEEALLVNPNDRQEIADCILRGFTMPVHEQRSRINKMQTKIEGNDVFEWASDFLNSIDQVIETVEAEL